MDKPRDSRRSAILAICRADSARILVRISVWVSFRTSDRMYLLYENNSINSFFTFFVNFIPFSCSACTNFSGVNPVSKSTQIKKAKVQRKPWGYWYGRVFRWSETLKFCQWLRPIRGKLEIPLQALRLLSLTES